MFALKSGQNLGCWAIKSGQNPGCWAIKIRMKNHSCSVLKIGKIKCSNFKDTKVFNCLQTGQNCKCLGNLNKTLENVTHVQKALFKNTVILLYKHNHFTDSY